MNAEFSLPAVSGQTISFDSFPNAKGYIVVFTCNHCPYAIAYEKRLIELHNRFAPQGFPVIAISSNDAVKYPQDSFENMKVRAEQKGFPFPYVFDESQEVARAYGAERTPHAFILQKTEEGAKLVYKGAIDDNYKAADQVEQHYVAEYVERLLAGKEDSFTETIAVGCSIKWQ